MDKRDKKREKPFIVILNKVDLVSVEKLQEIEEKVKRELGCEISKVTTSREESIQTIKNKIIEYAPKIVVEEKLIGDKIKIGDKILLVAPQDIQAPKGRLILPQVQVIRDILDNGGIPTVVTLDNLKEGLAIFQWKPDLVITDSQVFKTVDEILDKEVPLTSFSIIMARAKGDLETLYRGAKRINSLKEGDRV